MPCLQSPLDGFLILWDILGYVAPCDAYTRTNLRLEWLKSWRCDTPASYLSHLACP